MPDKEDVSGVSGTAGGLTINLGGFQTARIDCWATLPCTVKTAKKKYAKCRDFVMTKIAGEAGKIFSEYREINGKVSQ